MTLVGDGQHVGAHRPHRLRVSVVDTDGLVPGDPERPAAGCST
jgi:hypothetical protein